MAVFVFDQYYLGITALVTFVYQMSFYFVAAVLKIDTVTDLAGGSNFVVLTIMTLLLGQDYSVRPVLLTCMISVWGARIAGTSCRESVESRMGSVVMHRYI